MAPRKKVMYVVDTKDEKRHSRNCSFKPSPGQYEEPDVISSSDEENEVEDESLRIINAVRQRLALWDNRMSKVERNPTVMGNLWAEVDEELGMDPGKPKILWTKLRHHFSSERRKVESGEKTNWPYYSPLLFLIATRQPKQQSAVVALPQTSTPKIVVPKMFEPKKKKGALHHQQVVQQMASNYQQVVEESTQLIPAPSRRGQTKSNKEPLYIPPSNSEDVSRKRERSAASSDSDVDVVEEINLTNGALLQRHIENPISYKRVCIRRMQETQLQNIDDDDEDDEIRRFCSYLEVMLKKMPKMHQEMFCEETLDHLASVNRKLRRSNF